MIRSSPQIPLIFNSQPHEEADKLQKQAMKTSDFSTHSLTKRLTKEFKKYEYERDFSTHSLTKRLTSVSAMSPQGMDFQLTASRRG